MLWAQKTEKTDVPGVQDTLEDSEEAILDSGLAKKDQGIRLCARPQGILAPAVPLAELVPVPQIRGR